ncbi:MAG: hypothetical protein J6L23_04850 [Clostridia bacterium]|nr:hypothetical protein [Clostridia bacterium]
MAKRLFVLFLALLMVLPMAVACEPTETESKEDTSNVESETSDVSEIPVPDKNASLIWDAEYADSVIGLNSAEDVYDARYYFNGSRIDDYSRSPADGDGKYVFAGKEGARIINHADGYMLSFPGSNVEADFSISDFRSKYKNGSSVLTVTLEDQNPYGNNENGWNTYRTEWLTRHIDNMDFINANKLSRTGPVETYTDLLEGYEVTIYNMFIRLSGKIEMPYYNIAVIRREGEYVEFYLMVMKSTEKADDTFLEIVKSFSEIERQGEATNAVGAYELKIPENWSAETKAYYDKLMNQTTVDWGAFPQGHGGENADWLWSEAAMDHTPEIYMTYLHIGYYDRDNFFDVNLDGGETTKDRAAKYAGGNGFNGKPVLNLTYQFTRSNNALGETPMFDILRGNYDNHFRKLAKALKEYGKPILFRLNNEMNTDWTSYSGIHTLLDPDIFIMCWQRMYNIFQEEGVDNCIWIFNPIATSCPYSDWGEHLNYWPGSDYVQMYGITNYEMNNGANPESFKSRYTYVYNNSTPYFDNFPWIIGEFACGAGSEKEYDWGIGGYVTKKLGRNVAKQTQWVKDMFKCFENNQAPENAFCKNIKAAVWFSANDYASIDGKNYITNYLRLDEGTMSTIQAFKEYFDKIEQNQK